MYSDNFSWSNKPIAERIAAYLRTSRAVSSLKTTMDTSDEEVARKFGADVDDVRKLVLARWRGYANVPEGAVVAVLEGALPLLSPTYSGLDMRDLQLRGDFDLLLGEAAACLEKAANLVDSSQERRAS